MDDPTMNGSGAPADRGTGSHIVIGSRHAARTM
jgi:hypothetical protein